MEDGLSFDIVELVTKGGEWQKASVQPEMAPCDLITLPITDLMKQCSFCEVIIPNTGVTSTSQ